MQYNVSKIPLQAAVFKYVHCNNWYPRRAGRGALLAFGAVLFLAAGTASAKDPVLDLPISCQPGRDCWLVQMVDRDPGPGYADYRCGALSYDGHKGTDIAIGDQRRMQQGVSVAAAADGVVLSTRDGVQDRVFDGTSLARNSIAGIDCGNGVLVQHADGWTTQYCHLRQGSVTVGKGSRVTRGQPLGLVGLSGRTEFPHVHMTVRHGSSVIDPFSATTEVALCDAKTSGAGLWSPMAQKALAYPGPQPYAAGFAAQIPDKASARAGELSRRTFPADADAIVFWVDVFTLGAGDRMELSLTGPDGKAVAARGIDIDRPFALWFGYAGRKRPGDAWPAGVYTGRTVIRRGERVIEKTETLTVE